MILREFVCALFVCVPSFHIRVSTVRASSLLVQQQWFSAKIKSSGSETLYLEFNQLKVSSVGLPEDTLPSPDCW